MSQLSHGFGRLKDLADVPSTVGNEFKYLGLDGAGNPIWDTPAGGGGGSGDVVGPGSATDNAVARFDTATGKLIQNSAVTIDDSGNIATSGTVDGRDLSVDGTKLDGIATGATANSSDATLLNRANHTGTQLASTISDFDIEVSNNTDVAANTAARHAAVTVTDSAEIDFTLTGQNITASIIAGSIDETKLDISTNASLDLADTSLQPAAIGVTVQGYSAVLAGTTASFTTAQQTKLGHISVTQAVDLDQMELDIAALDQVVILKGTWDASVGTFPGTGIAQAGFSYIVSVGGTVDGQVFTANDRIVAITDNASTTVYASNWHKLDYTDQVLSVNSQTGAVLLDTDDIDDTSTTNKFTTATEISKLAGIEAGAEVNNISDVNATDLTDSGDSALHFHSADRARANHTGTQLAATISDFDTAVAANSAVTANTAKITNATHTGDATGATALTLASVAITGKTAVVPVGADYILISDTSDSGNLKKSLISDLPGGGGGTTVNTGQVEVDFGSSETDSALATVTAAWVLTTSKITCNAAAIDTTDHLADEVWAEGITAYPINIVDGVSFDIVAKSCGDGGSTWGKYKINYMAV